MERNDKHVRPRLIIRSGLWTQPIAMALVVWLMGEDWMQTILECLLFSFIPMLLLYVNRLNGSIKEDVEKPAAMRPDPPSEMLRNVPAEGDIVLGKSSDKYVCRSIREDGHYLIIGGSGSGKSSAVIIPTLIKNSSTPALVLDIKGELSAKATMAGSPDICIFNPQDRGSYGYDPFYELNDKSTEQQRYETMQTIAFSLISMSPGLKDPFWKNSARSMLIGLMLYHYRQGCTDLISIADAILSMTIQDSVAEVMKKAQPLQMEYKLLVQFAKMSEETISGVFSEMANAIMLFATDEDIRYALKYNPKRVSPLTLKEGASIYLVIQEDKLAAYYNILQLILNETMHALERRPEDSRPILFVIDELPRILSAGKIERLMDACRTLRSRNVRMILVTQSLEALMIAYSENEAIDLVSNCSHKIILDASSSKTAAMVCEWGGTYKELKRSISGKNQRTATYEEKDILQPSDLMTLAESGELILISPHGYNRLQKCFYFSDPYFSRIAADIKEHNDNIAPLREEHPTILEALPAPTDD